MTRIKILCLLAFTWTLELKGQTSFNIDDVSGRVEAWSLMTPNWKLVRNKDLLAADSLLRVHQGATVTLVFGEMKKKVHIATPMTLRLDEQMLRQVEENEIILSKVPDKWKSNGNPIALSLSEAWRRTKLRLKEFAKFTSEDKKNMASVSMPSFQVKRASSDMIDVTLPAQNQIYRPDSLPTQIKIQWVAPADTDRVFDVYIWRQDSRPREPVASVRSNHYFATINGWGGHYLQVVEKNGSSSEVVVFDAERGKIVELAHSTKKHLGSYVTLEQPSAYTEYYVSGENQITQKFRWQYKTKISEQHKFILLIKDALTQKLERHQIDGTEILLELDPARVYIWRLDLEINRSDGLKQLLQGQHRIIKIERSTRESFGDSFSKAIETLNVQTTPHRTIYFEFN